MYVLLCVDNTLYTGVTNDIDRRVNEHNHSTRGAKYTKARRPVKMVFFKEYKDRSSAQKAEYKFKKLSRVQKDKIINEGGGFN